MQKVQQDFANAAHAASLASLWVERNQSLEPELQDIAPDVLVNLGRATTLAGYSVQNLAHRPTIGLFGASQAGKSYLVSSLAAGPNGKLSTHWDLAEIDFIRHVNPSGNNSEATGFATRFTHEHHANPVGYPIELKVLGEMELCMILINAFFADINQSDVKVSDNEDYYLKHLDQCESFVDHAVAQQFITYPDKLLASGVVVAGASGTGGTGGTGGAASTGGAAAGGADGSNSTLNLIGPAGYDYFVAGRTINVNGQVESNYIYPEQVLELADYVTTNSNGKLGGLDAMPKFWLRLSRMLPFMTLEGRIKTLSIFWQNLAVFNETYRTLATELLSLRGHSVIFAPMQAFVTPMPDGSLMQNATGTIMHITKLSTMFRDTATLTCALARPRESSASGELEVEATVQVNVSRLAALALELRFNLESSGSLDKFDVLDLPGARSRDVVLLKDVIDDSAKFQPGKPLDDAMQMRGSEFFRRGKVGYLFERYARRNEIDQLLFCIGVNAQQDVTTVLTILSDWVEKNVGDSPALRANRPNPLTIILTRYDEVFNRQLKNLKNNLPLDMNQELNIALNRIQKLNWFTEWTPGRPFSRVLLARKPNLGDINPWIDFDPATSQELGISADSVAQIEQIKAQLLSVSDFNVHISNFAQALDNVLALNDGGVKAIAELIATVAKSDKERESALTYKVTPLLRECFNELSNFATRDSAQALEKAKVESKALTLGLLQCNAIAPCFDLLRMQLEIDPERLEVLYQQGFAAGSNVKRFVQAVCQEYLTKLSELSRKDNVIVGEIAEIVAESYDLQSSNITSDPNNIQSFSLCYDFTEQRFKRKEEFKEDVVALINRFYSEMIKTFSAPQLNIRSYMEQVLLQQENINESFGDVVRAQVQLISNILGDFNLYLGVNLIPNSAAKAAQLQSNAAEMTAAASAAAASAASAAAAYTPAQGAGVGFAQSAGAGAGASMSYGDEGDFEDFSDLYDADADDGYTAVVQPSSPAAMAPAAPVASSVSAPAAPSASSISPIAASMMRQPSRPVQMLQAGQSVLGTAEGPMNHFSHMQAHVSYHENGNTPAFGPLCNADDTGLLPHLDERSRDYAFKFVSDYMSTLMFMMCQINVNVESKYHFATVENLLLCQILNTLDRVC